MRIGEAEFLKTQSSPPLAAVLRRIVFPFRDYWKEFRRSSRGTIRIRGERRESPRSKRSILQSWLLFSGPYCCVYCTSALAILAQSRHSGFPPTWQQPSLSFHCCRWLSRLLFARISRFLRRAILLVLLPFFFFFTINPCTRPKRLIGRVSSGSLLPLRLINSFIHSFLLRAMSLIKTQTCFYIQLMAQRASARCKSSTVKDYWRRTISHRRPQQTFTSSQAERLINRPKEFTVRRGKSRASYSFRYGERDLSVERAEPLKMKIAARSFFLLRGNSAYSPVLSRRAIPLTFRRRISGIPGNHGRNFSIKKYFPARRSPPRRPDRARARIDRYTYIPISRSRSILPWI